MLYSTAKRTKAQRNEQKHDEMNTIKLKLISLTLLLLCSCVSQNPGSWPETIPQQEFFVDAYSADPVNRDRQTQQEYLGWIRSFYQGSLVYQNGWLEVEAAVLASVQIEGRDHLDSQLTELGVAIASEWAKHNDVRRIDSRMLGLWGSVLQLAANFQQQRQSIEVINDDVDALLTGSIGQSDIQDARYERMLQIELFGGF